MPLPITRPCGPRKVGVLLANLGTPDGYDYWPMRRYLNEFLSDKRVIDYPRLEMAAAVADHHPDQTAVFLGRQLQADLEPRAERKPADDDHQGADGQDCRGDRSAAWRSGDGRFLHALWQSIDRIKGARRWSMRDANGSCSSRCIHTTRARPLATANDQFFRALMKEKRQPAARIVPEYFDHPAVYQGAGRFSHHAPMRRWSANPMCWWPAITACRSAI